MSTPTKWGIPAPICYIEDRQGGLIPIFPDDVRYEGLCEGKPHWAKDADTWVTLTNDESIARTVSTFSKDDLIKLMRESLVQAVQTKEQDA